MEETETAGKKKTTKLHLPPTYDHDGLPGPNN